MADTRITEAELERYITEAREYAKRARLDITPQQNGILEDFKQLHTGSGTLKVQVTSGQGTLPVQFANVEVVTLHNGERLLLFSDRTDSSGIVRDIVLPALPTELSENYETAENSGTEYLVSVKHTSFAEINDVPIKIYNGIESILPINLIPVLR